MPFGGGGNNPVSDMNHIEEQLQDFRRKSQEGASTSNLSASDFWLVTEAGYEPLGLVLGNSVMSMGITGGIATAFKGLQRGELTALTQLMYDARELALQRMKSEATDLGADTIINVNLEIIHRSEDVMEVVATGTAVRKIAERSSRPITVQVR